MEKAPKNKKSAADYLPENASSLEKLRKAATQCHGRSLYLAATQTVFGFGSPKAKIIFVGEQPGDKEDIEGKPFVGPAGHLLESLLKEAGINDKEVYFTNAVKHFKFEEKGKRRLHKKPKSSEINACRPWLEAEITKIKPKLVVCLGATATQAIFGKTLTINEHRGQIFPSRFGNIFITVHPSSILRIIKKDQRHSAYKLFLKDLRQIAKYII